MKLAVTFENGEIFQHFGKTQFFKLYTVENGAITHSEIVGTGGQGHSALAAVLKYYGADALICGGIGAGAQNALTENGIRLYPGITGSADAAAQAFAAGVLPQNPCVGCSHHEGEHGHSCGGHGEHHSCGH